MARKKVNAMNGLDSRDAVWALIRQLKTFTVRQLREDTTLSMSSVRDYCQGLLVAGYLEEDLSVPPQLITGLGIQIKTYRLIKDCGIDAPRVRKDGTIVTQGRNRVQMWRTMKVFKGRFSTRELAIHASLEECVIQESDAADYCKHLERAGYLFRVRSGAYCFDKAMNTGPKPPMIQRGKEVWDQNKKKRMWPLEDTDHEK